MSLWRRLIDVAYPGANHSIRRYREVKDWIAHDLDFYANANSAGEDVPAAMRQARQRANRGRAAELEMATKSLPGWYRRWLHRLGEEPFEAARNLRDLADATTTARAEKCVANIERWLRLEPGMRSSEKA
jgi:hypothetical protein